MKKVVEEIEISTERIQKLMARSGLGSRRQIEAHLAAGYIQVNGELAKPGHQIKPGDLIEFEKRQWLVNQDDDEQATDVIILHKPLGYITTRHDPEGRKTIFDLLPKPRNGRWVNVGRLDINTAGLIILTTNGELANRLMHPSYEMDREYLCRIHGNPSNGELQMLRDGIELEDGQAKFSDIVEGTASENNRWFNVVVMEGKNREVRRLWEAIDCQVSRLKRVRYGPIFLPHTLRPKRFEYLKPKDVRVLFKEVGLETARGILQLQPVKGRKARKNAAHVEKKAGKGAHSKAANVWDKKPKKFSKKR